MEREELSFESGGTRCAAWLYRPEGAAADVPCVVMAHGFSLTRHDGLAPYAEAFAAAGAAAFVFDHRHLGDSGGEPRQRFRRREQLADWEAAVACARALPGVDAARIVLWGFSFSGGHVVERAAADPALAAALVLCPFLAGLPWVLATPPRLSAWILPRAVLDAARRHNVVPVTGPPGEHGAMTFPGEADGFARAVPPGSPWRNEISPALFLTVAFVRPLAKARRLTLPLWVGLGERDVSVSRRAVEQLAARAPRAELATYPYDHFDAFTGDAPARVAADQVAFLRRQGILRGL